MMLSSVAGMAASPIDTDGIDFALSLYDVYQYGQGALLAGGMIGAGLKFASEGIYSLAKFNLRKQGGHHGIAKYLGGHEKQWLYDNCFITKQQYVQMPTRPRPVPKAVEALPDDAKIRVIGSSYGYRGAGTEDTPDNICIVVAGGEEQFGGMAGVSQSPYRNWIESVDAWR